jgi:Cu(I)/Ag(I) efflux system membrane protein CusA/SilA
MNDRPSLLDRLIRFCLEQKLIVTLLLLLVVGWGMLVAPFGWSLGGLPRDPVPVDAIPDIGENQQIVFTEWMGRSPQDVEDQVTYPLTVALLGIPGVKTIRSQSMMGFSTIYVIFEEDVEFYWSRSRIIEKLNSLPAGALPEGVQPALGPDATALGQVFWYTLEGRDPDGEPTGGWDLHELRTIQDWTVRYGLMSAMGVAEVASVGGYVSEYQIDVDPDAMRAFDVTLQEVFNAVRMSNVDVGARTIEVNKAEYVIRGLGFITSIEDIRDTVIEAREYVPVRIRDVAAVVRGPALRRGALDKEGAEAVGGVVVVRFGENPLAVIDNVEAKIDDLAPGLPSKAVIDWTKTTPRQVEAFARAEKFDPYLDGTTDLDQENWTSWLRSAARDAHPEWLTLSKVTIVPFYDRTGLIHETLGTLNTALEEEILITIIVVILMVMHLRSSVLIAGILPLAVLMCFIGMKLFKVDANVVALSGIAIAIGTIVDMGIVLCENILRHLEAARAGESKQDRAGALEIIYRASREVGGAVLTAVATTIIGFLPVFTMEGPEGRLFKPLAYTKTFALIASIIVALTIIPALAQLLFTARVDSRAPRRILNGLLVLAGLAIAARWHVAGGMVIAAIGVFHLIRPALPELVGKLAMWGANLIAACLVLVILTQHWEPLGPERGLGRNFIFVGALIGGFLLFFLLFRLAYPYILWLCLHVKVLLIVPVVVILVGATIWLGFPKVWGWLPASLRSRPAMVNIAHALPGLGKEFMPRLDEGSFLYMPTTMPHASIGECLDVLQKLDKTIYAVPEVEMVVGKIGRAETPLDPAPISMVETVINYKSEYIVDENGRRLPFRYDHEAGTFARDAAGELIRDPDGRPYRQWREHIRSAEDIWHEIQRVARLPGTTSAPPLQPIETRLVMLQSGMRAPMGIKVKGPDLQTIEAVGLELERLLKEVPAVDPSFVIADRIVGKPYLEIDIDRKRIARYGIHVRQVQDVIEVAVGGRLLTTTVEGRQRYPVRVRYLRELRDDIDSLERILVPSPGGEQIPLIELADIRYVRGPQVIKSEDTFLVSYVLFDKREGFAEVEAVQQARDFLNRKMNSGELVLPHGVVIEFAGNFENQVRSEKRLMIVLPLALFLIFMILYLQFRSVVTSLLVFSGILVAWSGGFLLIWLYGRPWFMDFDVFGVAMRDLFQVHPINLSVAVWVGFLALFGIASDDGVIIATYLRQTFRQHRPSSLEEIRRATLIAGRRRVRPCLMTSATTILALLPVLSSTGKGSDIMVPMAIPTFGGMLIVLITMFVVPVLWASIEEFKQRTKLGAVAAAWLAAGTFFVLPVVLCTVMDLADALRGPRHRERVCPTLDGNG